MPTTYCAEYAKLIILVIYNKTTRNGVHWERNINISVWSVFQLHRCPLVDLSGRVTATKLLLE